MFLKKINHIQVLVSIIVKPYIFNTILPIFISREEEKGKKEKEEEEDVPMAQRKRFTRYTSILT